VAPRGGHDHRRGPSGVFDQAPWQGRRSSATVVEWLFDALLEPVGLVDVLAPSLPDRPLVVLHSLRLLVDVGLGTIAGPTRRLERLVGVAVGWLRLLEGVDRWDRLVSIWASGSVVSAGVLGHRPGSVAPGHESIDSRGIDDGSTSAPA